MGGLGSGGNANAGRKPKERVIAFRHGQEGAKPAKAATVKPVEMPTDLSAEQQAVWASLAPHAHAARTLVSATLDAFRDLCEAIVVKRAMLAKIYEDGLTYVKVTVDGAGTEHSELKAHPLLSQHRGMMQRVEAGLVRFRLAPMGKEIPPTEKPDDPFEAFDEGSVQ